MYNFKSLPQLLVESFVKHNKLLAVSHNGNTFTYDDLNSKSNQVANYLLSIGVKEDDVVGVAFNRSFDMVACLIGILKSGAAFVPLDINYPQSRIRHIIDDSKASIVITSKAYIQDLSGICNRIITIEEMSDISDCIRNVNVSIHQDQLAYVIYTSGSSGKPKGVCVSHGNLSNSLIAFRNIYKFSQAEAFIPNASINFDPSLWLLLVPLMSGGTLVLLDEEDIYRADILAAEIKKWKIKAFHAVPSVLWTLLQDEKFLAIDSLSTIVGGGEGWSADTLNKVKDHFPEITFINLYGPTETTIYITSWIRKSSALLSSVPIGKAIENNKSYILNKNLQPVPIGVAGEIYISGNNVARCYLKQPAFTAERFIANPFVIQADAYEGKNLRLYKTGDLGKYLPDGNIQFLGRVDNQVKIRGFRVELSEIENCLINPLLSANIVLANGVENNKRLIAYIVPKDISKYKILKSFVSLDKWITVFSGVEVNNLVAHLEGKLIESLPEYMVPSEFIVISDLPLTINGKIDTNCLLEIESSSTGSVEIDIPKTDLQHKLSSIWQEVLGRSDVGINDSFFKIGGHSLLAMQMLAKVRNILELAIPLNVIFKNPTILQLEKYINTQSAVQQDTVHICNVSLPESIPLSFAQQRLWLISKLFPDVAMYNIPVSIKLDGDLNYDALNLAIRKLIQQHESLRTNFIEDAHGVLRQVITQDINFSLEQNQHFSDSSSEVSKLMIDEFNYRFDLENERLFRIKLVKSSDNSHLLLLNIHHIIADGWSIQILLKDLAAFYNKACLGDHSTILKKAPFSYAHYAVWQRLWLKDKILDKQMSYWRNHLYDIPEFINLPYDFLRPKELKYKGAKHIFSLSSELSKKLINLGQDNKASLFMVMFASLQCLLNKYTQQNDIVIGTPVANRHYSGSEEIVGFFVNTLALRAKIKVTDSFNVILNNAIDTTLNGYDYQDLPFEQLVENLQIERHLNINPVFQVMLLVNKESDNYIPDLHGLHAKIIPSNYDVAKFDLTFSVVESNQGIIDITIQYSTELFAQRSINRLASHFNQVLEQIVLNKAITLEEIEITNSDEKKQILESWNDTGMIFETFQTIHSMFESQASRTPNNIAAIFAGRSVTYNLLNKKANYLARILVDKKIGPDTLVAVVMNKSLDMLTGLLAILKSGGTYVPIDPNYPVERLQLLLSEINPGVILTQISLLNKTQDIFNKEIICVDFTTPEDVLLDTSNLNVPIHPKNLAYIIYTSGSTGKPKGVAIEHQSCVNTLQDINSRHRITAVDRSIILSNYNFDLSVYDIFGLLGVGGAVVIPTNEEINDPTNFSNLVHSQNVTIWNSVPAFMQLWINSLNRTDNIPECLRLIMLSGDKIPLGLPDQIRTRSLNNDLKIYSLGGATEASIWSIDYHIQNVLPTWESIPYGRPLSNQNFYVLDEFYNLVPESIVGNLYIGGIGLARNYFNQPDLTSERFIANPFVTESDAKEGFNLRLYKTGDLGKYLSDGNIEFLGRSDNQVKIRGFRIELGEIEKNFVDPMISQNIVLARNDKQGKILVAYVVPKDIDKYQIATPIPNSEIYILNSPEVDALIVHIQKQLSQKLPEYMIPSEIVVLNNLPLTVNAKVDSKFLLSLSSKGSKVDLIPPVTELHKVICSIWQEVLNLKTVGILDNFFRIGGHSLLAAQMIAKIRDALNINLPLKVIFNNPNVSKLCEYIQNNSAELNVSLTNISSVNMPERVPLSFAQQRLWIISKLFPNVPLYNIPVALQLFGNIDHDALEQALQLLIKRHSAFRTNFFEFEGQAYQTIHPHRSFILMEHTIKDSTSEVIQNESNYNFDLQNDMLIRVKLICLDGEQNILLLNFHHIVSDGWSVQLFIKELSSVYNDICCNQNIRSLEDIEFDYSKYSVWQRGWLKEDVLERQLSYWSQHLDDIPVSIDLPYDYMRPQEMKYTGARHIISLPEDLSKQVVTLGKNSQSSLFIVMLASLQCLLQKYTQQSDIVIGTPIANRHQQGTDKLIGLFVNTLALRNKIQSDATFTDILTAARESVLAGYSHQDLPFEKLVEHLHIDRHLNINPIFQVMLLVNSVAENRLPTLHNLQVDFLDAQYDVAKFDLTFNIIEKNDCLDLSILYSTELFAAETISRLANHFKQLLQQITKDQYIKLHDIDIVTESEQQQILIDWNDTNKQYELKAIHCLFEEQVKRTPHNIAATYGDSTITYTELNSKANRLARILIDKGIRPDVPVGLIIDRSFEMIIGLLAILKAGGAYVPLDPGFPLDRLKIVLNEINGSVIVTNSPLLDRCQEIFEGHIICVDVELEEEISCSAENLDIDINLHNLAYVIYTSGSTGSPKGVAIPHIGLTNRILWMQEQYGLNQQDKVLQKTPTTFDVSGWELHWPLITGATMVIAEPGVHKDAEMLGSLIYEKNVTVLHFVPTMLEAMLNTNIKEQFKDVRMLFASGEALSANLYRSIKDTLGLNIHNLYGPTEASIDVTYNNMPWPNVPTIPIGKPISNIKIYILDDNLNPVPVGVAGQLYIQGIGLARGYIQRPDLTAEKFIANPFSTQSGNFINDDLRLYKTGDLARFLPGGDIEYIARMDSQVKIRGFRIELGEIEQSIVAMAHLVQSCSVQVFTHPVLNNKYIEAFVVLNNSAVMTDKEIEHLTSEIKQQLERYLPDYMVPSYITAITELPRNTNGKLNNNLLLELSAVNNKASINEHVKASNDFERGVSNVWMEVLKSNSLLGVTDDFFKSGGDSILAIRLVIKLNKIFNTKIQVKDIFLLKTIKAIAYAISKGNFTDLTHEDNADIFVVTRDVGEDIEEKYPASYLQSGMLLAANIADNHTYHDVFSYAISHTFNETVFLTIWISLIRKHSMLRAAFISSTNAWDICVYKAANLKYTYHDNGNIETIVSEERVKDFDYTDPGLFRLIINETASGFDFVLSFHHAIADGWSIASLVNEFLVAYIEKKEISGEERLSYSEYVRNEILAINNTGINSFWGHYLRDIELTSLRSNSDLTVGINGLHISRYELDDNSIRAVNKLQVENDVSPDCIFLQAYINTLHKFTAIDEITVGLVVNNRIEKEYGDEFFGMFLNTIPLKIDVTSKIITHSIFSEKLMLKNYQHLPYGHIKAALGKDIFECAFNYINFHILQGSERFIDNVDAIERTSIPLMLHVSEKNKRSYAVRVVAHDDYISINMLDRFLAYFKISLDEILHGSSCSELTEEDLEIADGMNATVCDFYREKTIHGAFEENVLLYPKIIALTDELNSYSYEELNDRSNYLARKIRSEISNRSEPVVGLMLERGADIIIAILAALKAGAVYLPLDPDLPNEKTKQILEISKPDLIICHEQHIAICEGYNTFIFKEFSIGYQENLNISISSNNLAYILFTSGTTGVPKGVGVTHKSVINIVNDLSNIYDMNKGRNIAAFSSYTFDVSVSEFFSALLQGSTLHILSDEARHDPLLLQQTLLDRKINHIYIPPAMLSMLPVEIYPDLKTIIYAGEPCPKDIAIRWSDKVHLYNYYGPTEATIYATGRRIENSEVHLIGKPVANTYCYVLDSKLSMVPVGAIGELYIGGVGITRGYLYSPSSTADKYIANPFAEATVPNFKDNLRLYKTGDLVKITTDGNLEYIGRSDNQIKIRGFRVELEEIENHLRRNTLVTNAKVLYIDNHVRAYVSIVENARLTSQHIINQLNDDVRLLLPEHMRPTQYVLLSVIPTNSSGKIDLNTLKTMQPENISFSSKDVEYRCSTEMLIAKEFSSLLGITKIDRNDSFFTIGGNSMLAAKLVYKINDVLGTTIKVSDIYLHKNISNIATLIKFQGNTRDNLVKLNVSSGCENLYMIHPGGVGCEVYQNLANALNDKFSCYGIDSYNMYSHNKITNVEEIAALYLSYIDANCSSIKDDRVYNILGWSLGGYIALEMARQLEQRGVDNIRLILLDTVWMYANNSPLIDDEMLNNFESEVKYNQNKRFSAEGFDKYYINSRLDLTTAELKLSRSKPKAKLVNADILLFKAMLEDTRVKSPTIDLVNKYIASCKLNNIDDFVANTDQLKTIQVFAQHGSMLDDLQPLLDNIAEFLCSEEIYEA